MFWLLLYRIQTIPAIFPNPNELTERAGSFLLTKDTKISYDNSIKDIQNITSYMQRWIYGATGYDLEVVDHPLADGIVFTKSESKLDDEEYILDARESSIIITASQYNGFLYGFFTFLQLLPVEIFNLNPDVECQLVQTNECRKYDWKPNEVEWKAQCVYIKDKPVFGYRGMMIDVSRYFFTADEIKRIFRFMSVFKLNKFHFHIVDNNGNRFESKKFPKLTTIGSIREQSPKPWHIDQGDGKQYGSFFYTQDELRDLIHYGMSLGITIIPEFEMPGHSDSACAGYPEFNCNNVTVPVRWKAGTGSPDVFCPGKDSLIESMKSILGEVIDVFPSPFVHTGGDECDHSRWTKCPRCQDRIKKHNLKDVNELQAWFTNQMAEYVESRGRTLITWGDALNDIMIKSTVIMPWSDIAQGPRGANAGHMIINSLNFYTYVNFQQFPTSRDIYEYNWYVWQDFLPFYGSYSNDPYLGIKKELRDQVLGLQVNAWTLYIWGGERDLHYKLFPRACAIAEVGWTKKVNRNWHRFFTSFVRFQQKRNDFLGIYQAPIQLFHNLSWDKSTVTSEWSEMSWNVTETIYRDCNYHCAFIKKGGANDLRVRNIRILVNGELWARDSHEGVASMKPNYSAFFEFELKKKIPTGTGTNVQLVAEISSEGGNDSYGDIYLYATTFNK